MVRCRQICERIAKHALTRIDEQRPANQRSFAKRADEVMSALENSKSLNTPPSPSLWADPQDQAAHDPFDDRVTIGNAEGILMNTIEQPHFK